MRQRAPRERGSCSLMPNTSVLTTAPLAQCDNDHMRAFCSFLFDRKCPQPLLLRSSSPPWSLLPPSLAPQPPLQVLLAWTTSTPCSPILPTRPPPTALELRVAMTPRWPGAKRCRRLVKMYKQLAADVTADTRRQRRRWRVVFIATKVAAKRCMVELIALSAAKRNAAKKEEAERGARSPKNNVRV